MRIAVCAAAVCACATPKPPPVAFVDSQAFAAIEARAYGVISGEAESVAVEKSGPGYVATLYARRTDAETGAAVWTAECRGPHVPGDELDALRFVPMQDGALLLVAATDANPDVVSQSFALVDVNDACAARYSETVKLPRPLGEVIAPERVPAGIMVDERGLCIVDEPQRVRLDGAAGEVELLLSVRERRIVGSVRAPRMPERRLPLLEERAVQVSFNAAPAALPEALTVVRDGDAATLWRLEPGQSGTLTLEGDAPLRLLELHYGCDGAGDAELELGAGEQRWHTDERPGAGSFIYAVGRAQPAGEVSRRLAVLREATAQLDLAIAATGAPFCLRELRAYGIP